MFWSHLLTYFLLLFLCFSSFLFSRLLEICDPSCFCKLIILYIACLSCSGMVLWWWTLHSWLRNVIPCVQGLFHNPGFVWKLNVWGQIKAKCTQIWSKSSHCWSCGMNLVAEILVWLVSANPEQGPSAAHPHHKPQLMVSETGHMVPAQFLWQKLFARQDSRQIFDQ